MVSSELEVPDPPACPLLGLAADRRSHFTYLRPGHRCFAGKHQASVDASRQVAYCPGHGYTGCDRYEAGSDARRPSGVLPPPGGASREASTQPAGEMAGPRTAVHVVGAGDSLARIAYGLTVEQISAANGLNVDDVVADGARFAIPVRRLGASVPGVASGARGLAGWSPRPIGWVDGSGRRGRCLAR